MAIRKSRINFYTCCRVLQPDFYTDSKPHLKILCDTLQALYEGRLIRDDGHVYKRLIINMIPRVGKTRTLVQFSQWCLGDDRTNRILSLSYGNDPASDFSRYTRDGIDEKRNTPEDIVYSDIFPKSRIKRGHASFMEWALDGEFFSYKGAGIDGGVTGKGATILICDDIVQNAKIALNEAALDGIWRQYTGTVLSRKEGRKIEIMMMNRWAKKDPCGRILNSARAKDWYILSMEAMNKETGEMLCEELLPREDYEELRDEMMPEIFEANYHQMPIDIRGTLYKNLLTYKPSELPPAPHRIISYTDTADEGNCYLCSIVAIQHEGEGYVVDVYLTKEGMEITEPGAAEFFNRNRVGKCKIESNSGGRGWGRAVQKEINEHIKEEDARIADKDDDFTEEDRHWYRVPIIPHNQTENKMARILVASNFIMKHIKFPEGWDKMWPLFHRQLCDFQKDGKNEYLDAPDALTGLAEMINRPGVRVMTIDTNARPENKPEMQIK